jgi:hypothetical protein
MGSKAHDHTRRRQCLLGIFDVYMTLIYGEGKKRAFTRLNKKVNKSSKG